ncbi:helix-turn-helix domain-containing protein [Pseudonocardia sp. ICBG1034]|uniref:helix-turn-helix domain-containing protein n=1 Tax=Pseudonocardia sp. ICBG1034 TaxID=2844381 RepID=UPI001CD02213|nr:helix-turn-helix domain-containing protein [Pseudonocardia sp. ICBG1034]
MDEDPRRLPPARARHQRVRTVPPPADLAGFVERFWIVDWHYDRPYRQKVVPYPQVHLTVQPGAAAMLAGPATRYVHRELTGTGRVVGAALRAGTARALVGAPVSTVTDRRCPVAGVVAADVNGLTDHLRARLPADGPDRAAAQARDLVATVAGDRSLVRVDDLARDTATSVRSLQRLFHDHVGVGPKWVIRRYRLHEVTELMAAGVPVRWAEVAADLGYADQAHLSRDFTRMFGEPPTSYARRY